MHRESGLPIINGDTTCKPFWPDNSLRGLRKPYIDAVKKGNAKEVASYEQRGVLYREGFIDDHERPIETILTPLKAAIAKCEGLHRSSGGSK